MKKFFILLFFSSLALKCYSQEAKDSILETLAGIKDQTVLMDSLLSKAEFFRRKGLPEKTLFYGQEAIKVAVATKDKTYEASGLLSVGNAYYAMGKYKEALDNSSQVLNIAQASKNELNIPDLYNLLGSISLSQNKKEDAIGYFSTGIEKTKKLIGNRKSLKLNTRLARLNSNLGVIYASSGDFKTAVGYFEQTAAAFLQAGDSVTYATSLSNVGAAYFYLNEPEKSLKNYFTAKEIAIRYNDKETITRLCENIASVYIQQNKFAPAREYLELGLNIAREMKNKDLEKTMYKSFYDLYVAQKDPATALSYYIKYTDAKDSLLNESNLEQVNNLNKKYDSEKKEQKIELLNKEKQVSELEVDHQKSQRNMFITGFALVVVLLGFLAYNFIQKSKNNKLLEEKNKLITLKNHTIEEKNKEIIDSITYAKRIQSALLASDNLLQENLKDYFILFMPKDIVSGDFYWASVLRDGTFALVIADSTGHGVPGAFMSLLNITFLNEAINEKGFTDTGEILTHTRRKIIESLAQDGSSEGGKDGMDCTLANYDFKNKVLHYSCAYNPIWIIRTTDQVGTKELIELQMDKMPVGKHDRDEVPFSHHVFALQAGDVVYSLTDGYADQFGGDKGKKFKYKPLQELLKSISQLEMSEQQRILQEKFTDWRGNLEQVDDVCISGVKIR